jgi:hypothetical protein
MEKADETTNVCGETSIIDLGKDLSIKGGVEINNANPLEGSSVILGEQNIEQDGETSIQDQLTSVDYNYDEDQASNSEEVEWNNDGDGGSTDYSEVENDSSNSSVKLSAKHIKKKSNNKFKNVAVEEDDDRSESCESGNSHFSLISSTEPQGEPELLQFSWLSSLNSEECSSATVIDVSIKKHKRIEGKDMAMLVFNPCIIIFSQLFNVIMVTLTILTRRHWSSVFWLITNWSEPHQLFLRMLKSLFGGRELKRVIPLHYILWCLKIM